MCERVEARADVTRAEVTRADATRADVISEWTRAIGRDTYQARWIERRASGWANGRGVDESACIETRRVGASVRMCEGANEDRGAMRSVEGGAKWGKGERREEEGGKREHDASC
ncbi:hypothetical protein DENSPDRAFT_851547 [Dentipellis sp. KUC8613]|nr:hypothetical protein DENSPDRAFT_851547 [Dentipellis sp. KUC8613]